MGLPLIKALSNGYGAVVAFFVISGFVLARSLDRNFSASRFARGRIFRLFPAAIMTIGLFAALFYGFDFVVYRGASYAPLDILANMAMLRADIDRVMWSMKAELAATPLIFACVWLFRRRGTPALIATAVVLFGLAFIGQYSKLIGDDTNLALLFAFPVGILVHFKGEAMARQLRPAAALLGVVGSVAVFCACAFFKPSGTWALLVQCLSAATLVMLIAYRSEVPLLTVLDARIVRFYGRISYSFYLLHPLTFWTTGQLTAWLLNGVDGLPLTVVAVTSVLFSVAAVTPLAYASWRLWNCRRWTGARRPKHRGRRVVAGLRQGLTEVPIRQPHAGDARGPDRESQPIRALPDSQSAFNPFPWERH